MQLTQSLRRALQIVPSAISTRDSGRIRTWDETASRVARFADALRKLGLVKGDRVAAFRAELFDQAQRYRVLCMMASPLTH